ncbi:MAG: hypothetical protein WHV67_04555 [Thermoanaerobaculia bacterium]
MKEKKKYEKPRILEVEKIEAIAGACAPAPPGKASSGAGCNPIAS